MRSLLVTVVVSILSALTVQPASGSPPLPVDDCRTAPVEVAVAEREGSDGALRWPVVLDDYTWFGDAIYTPSGIRVGDAPGYPSGAAPQFKAGIVDYPRSTSVLLAGGGSGPSGVYRPDGSLITALPDDVSGVVVYGDESLLVVEPYRSRRDQVLRAFLVTEAGSVTQLDVEPAEETDFVGAIAGRTSFVVASDGSVHLADDTGRPVATVDPQAGERFQGVFGGHGRAYAFSGVSAQDAADYTAVTVVDTDGSARRVQVPGSLSATGTFAGGFVIETSSYVRGELDGLETIDLVGRTVHLFDPSGDLVTSMPFDTRSVDGQVFRAHGRYLFIERIFETRMEPPRITSDLEVVLGDGTSLGSGEPLRYEYELGVPVGRLLATYGVEPGSIEFRSLGGVAVSTVRFGEPGETGVERIMTNHRYVWVEVVEWNPDSNTETVAAHVFDLGVCAGSPDPGAFVDDETSVFSGDIEWLASAAIARGCAPQDAGIRFCPDDPVTRGEMAAFLHRAMGDALPVVRPTVEFGDVEGSVFAADVSWLSSVGITEGCADGLFCPDDTVTREQMAAFLGRALSLPAAVGDAFTDDDGRIFEGDIERLAAAGITRGCADGLFCPTNPVTRGEMAAFLRRALD
ncbi:MAG: S-layer homology domain-containing protein [Acidimicrobiia bacterium]